VHTARFAWSNRPPSGIGWINRFLDVSMSAAWQTFFCVFTLTPAALPALVESGAPHQRTCPERSHRINSARLPALPVRSRIEACRFHHQRPGCGCGTRYSVTSSSGALPGCAWAIIRRFNAAQAHGTEPSRVSMSRMRVREPKRNILPLSVDESGVLLGEASATHATWLSWD